MGRHFAGILGLLAFLVVLVRGWVRGAGVEGTVEQAMWLLFGFGFLGYLAGSVAERVVAESVRSRLEAEMKARETDSAATRPGANARPA